MNTKPEIALRSALHRRGLRFRKDHPLRVGGVRVRPDVVFTRWKVAVFVDGCFWHRCPDHSNTPKRNTEYWIPKLQANVDRDQRVDTALAIDGWTVVRVWEHEDAEVAADQISSVVQRRRPSHLPHLTLRDLS
jgi:DNA mismatch endonuclease (patch repair protein)